MNKETLEEYCSCTDECLGYLTKTCKRLEQIDYTALLQPVGTRQETLEEVAENFWLNDDSMCDNDRISYVNGFRNGAKWQQERSYSEEDLHNAFYNGWLYRGEEKYKFQFPKAKKEWFEQFKKK